MYKERSYRKWVETGDLVSFEIVERETDLHIMADRDLSKAARESVLKYRSDLERYASEHPVFLTSLTPVKADGGAPGIVSAMAAASEKACVGPMAAVAGAMAEFVGRDLLTLSKQVIIENGGDIFLKTSRKRTIAVYAGEDSPFTGKLAIEIEPGEEPSGVCTSSGTVSHSLSFGNADAALIVSGSAALSDAAATAAGNAVRSAGDIPSGISAARAIDGVKGVLIIVGDKIGMWGEIKLKGDRYGI